MTDTQPIDFSRILSPEPGFERVPDDGDSEKLPRDAQLLGGKWWAPRFGSDSLNLTLDAIGDRLAEARAAALRPEPPSECSPKVEKTFYEYEVFSKEYITIAGGTTPTYEQSLSKVQGYLACHRQAKLDLEIRRIEVLNTDALQCQHDQAKAAPLPIAPQAELPQDPPNAKDDGSLWKQGYKDGWEAARDELQRQREGQGLPAPEPPDAPTLPHISDDLMRSLVCDILYMLVEATDKALGGGYSSPIPGFRARLMEILRLAAQEAEKPAS